jgi:hypothetical protein
LSVSFVRFRASPAQIHTNDQELRLLGVFVMCTLFPSGLVLHGALEAITRPHGECFRKAARADTSRAGGPPPEARKHVVGTPPNIRDASNPAFEVLNLQEVIKAPQRVDQDPLYRPDV